MASDGKKKFGRIGALFLYLAVAGVLPLRADLPPDAPCGYWKDRVDYFAPADFCQFEYPACRSLCEAWKLIGLKNAQCNVRESCEGSEIRCDTLEQLLQNSQDRLDACKKKQTEPRPKRGSFRLDDLK